MAMYIPAAARLDLANTMVAGFSLNQVYVHLLSSRVNAAETVTLAMLLAAEASFTGYAKGQLGNWSPASVVITQPSNVVGLASFFPSSAGGTGNIFGTFLTDVTQTLFFGAEDFGSVPTSTPGTEPYLVTLIWMVGPG